jgi:hypothetical protein
MESPSPLRAVRRTGPVCLEHRRGGSSLDDRSIGGAVMVMFASRDGTTSMVTGTLHPPHEKVSWRVFRYRDNCCSSLPDIWTCCTRWRTQATSW